MTLAQGTRHPVARLVVGWLGSMLVLSVMFMLSLYRHHDLHRSTFSKAASLLAAVALLASIGFFLAAVTAARPRTVGAVLDRGPEGELLVQLERAVHPFRLFLVGSAVGLLLGVALAPALGVVGGLVLGSIAARLRRGRRLRLGPSSIDLGRPGSLGHDRFPYVGLREVAYDLERGELVITPRGQAPVRLSLPLEVGREIAELAMPRLPRRVRPHRLAPWLARRGRDLRTWTTALGQLLCADEGYREVPLAAADLADAVLDGTAPFEQRLGAGLALRAAGAPGCDELLARTAAALPAGSPSRRVFEALLHGTLTVPLLEAAEVDEILAEP